ncbi:phage head closure protein [Klebsiella variicola]|uniref:Head-tail adaptor protein n=1 Tax=Klebsiella pneumoniae TaxID=573 RepID=A0A060VJQ7_KLEPN|nr:MULTISPECIES: phage head closure protein [Klebsiella]HBX3591739.1 head-tail adaptor [Klebsiella pneumoniae subsp. pneumoniae]HBZ0067380.1 head-tail adaptor protein [Klebsiella pneumoniae subsp. ozaenae]HCB0905546.1 phage head closure protein [Klebsiella variicola subsp. variicola]HDU5077412.1 phage head closure protein [Klebsiella quasipneumoniae subsp. similipneumoniae]AWX77824.1 head-tail adaptor [Klebsiella variicola]
MRAGKMKRRVTFQKSESHRDQMGQVIYVWSDLATVWAEIRAISGRERMSSGGLYSEATVRIWTRYRDDITTANRILYRSPNVRGQVYGIVAVIPDVDHTRLELLCKGGIFNE